MNKDTSWTTIGLSCLGLTFLIPLVTVGLYALNGWVLSLLWQWFVTTTFGLSPLTIPQAIGVAIVVGFLTSSYKDTKQEERKGLAVLVPVFGAVIGNLVTLLAGYILYTSYFVH
jgi:hypothetical protein